MVVEHHGFGMTTPSSLTFDIYFSVDWLKCLMMWSAPMSCTRPTGNPMSMSWQPDWFIRPKHMEVGIPTAQHWQRSIHSGFWTTTETGINSFQATLLYKCSFGIKFYLLLKIQKEFVAPGSLNYRPMIIVVLEPDAVPLFHCLQWMCVFTAICPCFYVGPYQACVCRCTSCSPNKTYCHADIT